MEDLLLKHADRIEAANVGMTDKANEIAEKANIAARNAISEFGQKLVEATRLADAARDKFNAALQCVIDDAQTDLAGVFAENISALGASANSMGAEVKERTRFLATGELPERVKEPAHGQPEEEREQTTVDQETDAEKRELGKPTGTELDRDDTVGQTSPYDTDADRA